MKPATAAPASGPLRRPAPPADGGCELCRLPLPLTFHHLIPRWNHDKRWCRNLYTRAELQSRGAWLCRRCHAYIHQHFDEATLGRRLNSIEALQAEPLVARYLSWAQRQRVGRR